MIIFINTHAEKWVWIFGWIVISNTVFLGFLLITLFLLRNRSAKMRHNIAFLGIIKLLLPLLNP